MSTQDVTRETITADTHPPNVNKVFMMGGRNCGKTHLLAALAYRFAAPDLQSGLFARTSEHTQWLTSVFTGLVGKDQHFTTGNAFEDVRTIRFDFSVLPPTVKQTFPCTSILIYDYAGGALCDTGQEAEKARIKIMPFINDADILMIVLDGNLLRRSFADGCLDSELSNQLINMLGHAMTNGLKNTYFVISKWDVFLSDAQHDDSNQTLRKIRTLLERDTTFKNYVGSCMAAGSLVRLIPVSSVGPGFASPNPAVPGEMIIHPNMQPTPLHVQWLPAFIFPDLVAQEMIQRCNRLEEAAKKVEAAAAGVSSTAPPPPWRQQAADLLETAGSWIGHSADLLLRDSALERWKVARPFAERIGARVNQYVRHGTTTDPKETERQRQAYREQIAHLRTQVRSEHEAHAYVMKAFDEQVDAFDSQFPDGLLNRPL